MKDYKVISNSSYGMLEEEVKQYLNDGYSLVGGVSVSMIYNEHERQYHTIFAQAVGVKVYTPERILRKIRQRNAVQDNSQDAEFEKMSPLDKLRSVSGCELGDDDWADSFLDWAKDCGFEIKEGK